MAGKPCFHDPTGLSYAMGFGTGLGELVFLDEGCYHLGPFSRKSCFASKRFLTSTCSYPRAARRAWYLKSISSVVEGWHG